MKNRKHLILLLLVLAQRVVFSQCPAPIVPATDLANAVTNGGFETGAIAPSNAGSHTLVTCCSSPGKYMIGGLSTSFNTGLIPGVVPHSGTKMLMIDGVMASNAVAWEQTITVQENRMYYFSAWLTALSPLEKSQMVFRVTPVLPVAGAAVNISASFIPPNGPVWNQEFGTWFSGSTTWVKIQLINTNPLATGGGGNDYAIDDIVFRPTCEGVNAGPKPEFGAATLGLCNAGGSIDLNSNVSDNVNHTYSWFKDGASVANAATPNILESQTVAGQYVVCLDSAGCVQSDTVTLISTLSLDLGPDLNLCNPSFKLLDTRITAYEFYTIEWYKDNVLIPGQSGPTYTATGAGTYRVNVTDGGSCTGTDEIIITSQVDETIGDVICPSQADVAATVSVVDAGGAYVWYDAQTGGNILGTGLTHSATGLTGPVTYYVENSNPVISGAGLPDASSTYLVGSSNGPNNVHDQNLMNFSATINATIASIDVFMSFAGNAFGNVTITLKDKTVPTITIATSAINNVAGAGNKSFTIPINLPIIAGHNYEISIVGINGQFATLRYADGPISTYFPSVHQAVTLTGGQAPSVYPGLFNWKFSHPSTCARVPAVVSEFCPIPPCVRPTSVSLTLTPNTTNLCQGASITLQAVIDTAGLTPLNGPYNFGWYKSGVLISPITNVYSDLILSNVTSADAAEYKIVVEDGTNGFNVCRRSATTSITVDAPIDPGTIAASQVLCSGNTAAAFTSVVPASGGNGSAPTYSWVSSSDGVTGWSAIASASAATYSAGTVSSTTYYKRVASIGTACPRDSSNTISITVNPALVANTIATDQTICANSIPASLQETVAPSGGTGSYSRQWEFSLNGISGWSTATGSSTSSNYAPPALTDTTFYRVKISSGTCTDVYSNIIKIAVTPTSIPTISINSVTSICVGTNVNFTTTHTNEGATPAYQWYWNGAPVGLNQDSYSNSALSNGDSVRVVMTSSISCPSPAAVSSSKIFLTVLPIPTPQIIGRDTTFCSNIPVSFNSNTGGGTLTWLNNGVPITGAHSSSLSLTASGVYTLEEDNGACSAVSTPYTVVVKPSPTANAGPDQNVNDGTIVTLEGSGSGTYSWSPAAVLSNATIANPTFNAIETTSFTLTLTDATGTCTSTDEVTIFVFKNIIIPNVITPNGDGNNDSWEIKNLATFTSCSVEIFNVWGSLVWKSTGYKEEWKGENYRNDGALPDGTYYYVIDLNSSLAKEPYSGYVQIIK